MKYHFKVHKEKHLLYAECIELEGCRSQGKTPSELYKNLKEALNLYLAEPETSSVIFNLPKRKVKGKNIIEIAVEPRTAMAFYLRSIRLQNRLTQKKMAELLGYKNLFSYQRLENPEYANPELMTLAKIKNQFPEFQIDLILS